MTLRRSRVLQMLAAAPVVAVPAVALAQATKVRIAYSLADAGMGAYYAQAQGFFTKAGLDVELLVLPNAPAQMSAVVGNALDVGFADALQLGNAHLRGVPLAAFAGGAVYSTNAPTAYMCVAKNSPVKTAKDLEGQVVGTIALDSSITLAEREWLARNGVDSSKVKHFELPFPQMAPALQRGTITAAALLEPFYTFGRDDLRVIGKPYDVFGKTYTLTVMFTSRDWAARNPEVVRRLTGALYDMGRWANANQSETLQILSTAAKTDIERIRNMNRWLWATSFGPRDLQPILNLATKYQAFEKPVAARDLVISLR